MDGNSNQKSSRRLSCRWLAAVAIALVMLASPWILQSAYRILVVNQNVQVCRLAMVMNPAPECLDVAGDLIAKGEIDMLLLVDSRPDRPVRVGALKPRIELWRQELSDRDVPDQRIRAIQTQAMTSHQMFRDLDAVLGDQLSRDRCMVISTSTMSRHVRHVIDQSLSRSRANEFRVLAISPKSADAANWWHSRRGVARVLNHGLRLAFVCCRGESDVHHSGRMTNVQ